MNSGSWYTNKQKNTYDRMGKIIYEKLQTIGNWLYKSIVYAQDRIGPIE